MNDDGHGFTEPDDFDERPQEPPESPAGGEPEPVAIGAIDGDGNCIEAQGLHEEREDFEIKGIKDFTNFWNRRPFPVRVVSLFTHPPTEAPASDEFSFRENAVTDEMLLDRYADHRPEVKRLRTALEEIADVDTWGLDADEHGTACLWCMDYEHTSKCPVRIARTALDTTEEAPHDTIEYWKARYIEVRREQGVMAKALGEIARRCDRRRGDDFSMSLTWIQNRAHDALAQNATSLDTTEDTE